MAFPHLAALFAAALPLLLLVHVRPLMYAKIKSLHSAARGIAVET